jgi:mono/diheme cytochrome c family protein
MPCVRPRPSLSLLAVVATTVLGACERRARFDPDWDLTTFALEELVEEYPELGERGDFHEVPALAAVLDRAIVGLGPPRRRTRRAAAELKRLRAAIVRHEAPLVVALSTTRMLVELQKSRVPLKRPSAPPDIGRGAATYAVACSPCHGAPRGPLPAAAAHMVPPAPSPTESVVTPYQVFNRVTYGGLETAMPSFSETMSEALRWDVAFYLFADRWPPCAGDRPLPALPAAELAHLSDYDLSRRFGWGAAACLRRRYR